MALRLVVLHKPGLKMTNNRLCSFPLLQLPTRDTYWGYQPWEQHLQITKKAKKRASHRQTWSPNVKTWIYSLYWLLFIHDCFKLCSYPLPLELCSSIKTWSYQNHFVSQVKLQMNWSGHPNYRILLMRSNT